MLATDRFIGLRRIALIALSGVLLSNCSGDSGGGTAPAGVSFSVSPKSLNFTALTNSQPPPAQTVTLTTNGSFNGTWYFKVTVPGLFSSFTPFSAIPVSGPNSEQASFSPAMPGSLGPGTHTDTISIVACASDANCSGPLIQGSPQNISVTYTVLDPLQGDAVAPRAVGAGVAGEVVIRGKAIASLTGVSFGGNSATSINQVSATEVRAGYPALAAGSYPVQLQNASGPISFSGNLVVVDAPSYAATTLAYPASPGNFRSVIYDAMRQAIIVATDTQLLRYAYSSGAWQSPAQAAVAGLRDVALALDGASLLALTSGSLNVLDPVTFAQSASTDGPMNDPILGPPSFDRLALANDGIALVTGSQLGLFLYPTKNAAFYDAFLPGFAALPAVGDNGSLVALVQGQTSPAPAVLKYAGSSGSMSETSVHLQRVSTNLQSIDPAPAVDRSGTRIAINSSAGDCTGINVYDDSGNLLGALPATTADVAFAPNPAGAATRAYTLDSCTLRAFDLAAPLVGGAFVEIVTAPYPITLPGCPGNYPRMLITPDGGNAILAGDQQVVIVQTP